jgi:formylglycine-generating enzyme required for sulfatase activity
MTLLLLLGLAWRRRSSAVLLAALLSVLGCKKVVQATVNKADDTTPTESTSENNDMKLADCGDVPEPETSAGPKMIAVGRRDDSCVWIDTTEVTAAQLLGFVRLAARDRQDHYPAGCTVSELAPEDYAGGDMPAANVTWCDAAAFCAYAGKRLCAEHEDASEWQTVCTDGDHAEFAYEDLADPEVCNVQAETVADVGSFEDCRTPTGVFDLVGNVREWTAECSGTPPDGSCSVRGGSNLDKLSAAGCDASKSVERVHSAPDIGFRCCADVP